MYNLLREHLDSDPSCAAAHAAATSLYDSDPHTNAEWSSFQRHGRLVLALDVHNAVEMTDREDLMGSAGFPEGYGGVVQLTIAVGLGSEAAWSGASLTH